MCRFNESTISDGRRFFFNSAAAATELVKGLVVDAVVVAVVEGGGCDDPFFVVPPPSVLPWFENNRGTDARVMLLLQPAGVPLVGVDQETCAATAIRRTRVRLVASIFWGAVLDDTNNILCEIMTKDTNRTLGLTLNVFRAYGDPYLMLGNGQALLLRLTGWFQNETIREESVLLYLVLASTETDCPTLQVV
jgi:hypothetical protein